MIKAALDELAELKDQVGEGGGEPADLDRVYTITVGGSQSTASANPQGQTVYDIAGTSMHMKIFGTSFDWLDRLETDTQTVNRPAAVGMKLLILSFIVLPAVFGPRPDRPQASCAAPAALQSAHPATSSEAEATGLPSPRLAAC